jgi:hypothetical protein
MELELKHIAGYLPYGLNTQYRLADVINTCTSKMIDEVRNKVMTADNVPFVLEFCKPILRNLSDLTKEIEVDGEKFVPSIEYHYLRFEEISTIKAGDRAVGFIQIREQEILYKLHFDIHGLIEAGLAIDINTLNESK